jgi:hypothetical protein
MTETHSRENFRGVSQMLVMFSIAIAMKQPKNSKR